ARDRLGWCRWGEVSGASTGPVSTVTPPRSDFGSHESYASTPTTLWVPTPCELARPWLAPWPRVVPVCCRDGDSMERQVRPPTTFIVIAALLVGPGVSYLTTPTHMRTRTSAPVPIQHFGIADPDLILETATVQASQLAAMKAIGITSVRLDARWNWVQPSGPRTFDWTQLDRVVSSARAAGMSVDLIIDGCPPWAALAGTSGDPSPQPASSAQYATWAAEVAARYARKGVKMFEIWNEPNNAIFWQPKPNPAAYTAD